MLILCSKCLTFVSYAFLSNHTQFFSWQIFKIFIVKIPNGTYENVICICVHVCARFKLNKSHFSHFLWGCLSSVWYTTKGFAATLNSTICTQHICTRCSIRWTEFQLLPPLFRAKWFCNAQISLSLERKWALNRTKYAISRAGSSGVAATHRFLSHKHKI